jgi:hypothetical protein
LTERERLVEQKCAALNVRSNFTQLQLKAISEANYITAQLVKHNIEQLQEIRLTFPQLSVVVSNLVAKLHLLRSNFDRLIVSFRPKLPDIQALHTIFQLDQLLEVDPDSIISDSVDISAPTPNSLQVIFWARRRDTASTVYQVAAFRYWRQDNPTSRTLMEYTGPLFVVYNRATECVKGLNQVVGAYVSAQCPKKRFIDHRLGNWKKVGHDTGDDDFDNHQTEVIEAWPMVRIYCYPQAISIDGVEHKCPMYPFELKASTPSSTASYQYRPGVVEFKTVENAANVQEMIDFFHLRNNTGILTKDSALQRIEELHREVDNLSQAAIAFELSHDTKPLTYRSTTRFFLITTLAFMGVSLYQWGLRKLYYVNRNGFEMWERHQQQERRREARRSLNNIYAVPCGETATPMITFPS